MLYLLYFTVLTLFTEIYEEYKPVFIRILRCYFLYIKPLFHLVRRRIVYRVRKYNYHTLPASVFLLKRLRNFENAFYHSLSIRPIALRVHNRHIFFYYIPVIGVVDENGWIYTHIGIERDKGNAVAFAKLVNKLPEALLYFGEYIFAAISRHAEGCIKDKNHIFFLARIERPGTETQ